MRPIIPGLPKLVAGGVAAVLVCLVTLGSALAGGPPIDWAATPPNHVRGNATTSYQGGYTPSQIRHAYNFDQITGDGTGQTVAIVVANDDRTIENDLGVYSGQFNLPSCTTRNGCFQKVKLQGRTGTDSSWTIETALDVEMVHAVAPGAKIMLVEANMATLSDLFQAVTYAKGHGAQVVSMSWGGSEFSGESSYDNTFSQSGVAFVASSGDSGTGAEYPAASPNVLAVGGTTLTFDANGNATETAWRGSGGGISSYEGQPSYQSGFAAALSGSQRVVPDVSFDADPNTGVAIYDGTSVYGQSGWFIVGGTSVGAPAWAGYLAIVDQLRANQGQPALTSADPSIYQAATSSYSTDFRDISSGTNGSCGTVCTANSGYDAVTGLGSPLGSSLANSLTSE